MTNAGDTRDHDTYTARTSSTRIGALAGRYGLVIVIAWFGAMKFTFYEAQGISPLVANSPFMGWLYHVMSISAFGRLLGTAELVAAVLLALKPWSPKLSVLGGALAVIFFLGTLSFMLSTPGIGEASAGGFPVLSATGEFLMKDSAVRSVDLAADRLPGRSWRSEFCSRPRQAGPQMGRDSIGRGGTLSSDFAGKKVIFVGGSAGMGRRPPEHVVDGGRAHFLGRSNLRVDGEAGSAHAPRILLLQGFPSSSSTGHFALATAAGEIAQFVDDFFSNTTQRQRHGAAEPRI